MFKTAVCCTTANTFKSGCVCVLFIVEWDLLVLVLKQCTYLYKKYL